MATGLELISDYEYQSDNDDDEQKTTWILRSISSMDYVRACRNGINDEMFLRAGLIGWKNFPDSKGEEIPFSIQNMGRIPPLIAQDISFKIQEISVLTEDERKNS